MRIPRLIAPVLLALVAIGCHATPPAAAPAPLRGVQPVAALPIDDRPLRSGAVKSTNPNLLHGQTLTLLDTTGQPGPGNVEAIQIYIASSGGDQLSSASLWLRIYVDGEATAGVFMPVHQLFFCFAQLQGNNSPNNYTWATDNVACDYNLSSGNFGGTRNIFIPYGQSIRVTLTNYSATDDTVIDSQVVYRSGPIPGWRTHGRRNHLRMASGYANYVPTSIYEGFVGVNAFSSIDLINVSGRGELESLGLLIWNQTLSTSDGPLEGAVQTYIDSALINSYLGTEDYFYNQVYGAGLAVKTTHGGLVYRGPIRDVGGHGSQWFRLFGFRPETAQTFNTGLRINWTNGIASVGSVAVNIQYCVLYYTDH